MTIYSADKLYAQTRKLAKEYKETTGQVLPVTAELAKYDAAKQLNLSSPNTPEPGVDLIGVGSWQDEKILIKGRVIFDDKKKGQRIGSLNLQAPWQRLILVLYENTYEPVEMYAIKREDVDALFSKPLSSSASSRQRRGVISIAKIKILGELVWDVINGRSTLK